MALTESTMMPLGTRAPDFELPDTVTGDTLSLQQLKGEKGTLILFICNHCPYVMHEEKQLIDIARTYAAKGVRTVAISSNDIAQYPEDAPDKMKALMEDWGRPFAAYLYDESQTVAKAYQAACTPDIYLFDADLFCVYRGRLDDSMPKNNIPLTGRDLREALDNLLANRPINPDQIPSMGCNIKWKEG